MFTPIIQSLLDTDLDKFTMWQPMLHQFAGNRGRYRFVCRNKPAYPALDRAGIRRVRFHDLRHSFASNLLAAGVDIVTVSKALGHANVHITLTTYAHAVPKPRQGASDRMAELLIQSGNNLETGV